MSFEQELEDEICRQKQLYRGRQAVELIECGRYDSTRYTQTVISELCDAISFLRQEIQELKER